MIKVKVKGKDMSMHLLPCFVTTTNMKKRKQKRSKKQDAVDAAHTKFLKKMGYNGPVVQRSEPAAHNGVVAGSNPAGPTKLSNQIPTGVAPKKEPMQYSGKRKLLGIATMHKSNMVPVFSSEDAEAISKMRR
tara:strand:+ start:86 stop:481 length:396 start_codon:yes stop_codon:yes gene_type:complete